MKKFWKYVYRKLTLHIYGYRYPAWVPASFSYDNSSENDQDANMDMIILLFRHDDLV